CGLGCGECILHEAVRDGWRSGQPSVPRAAAPRRRRRVVPACGETGNRPLARTPGSSCRESAEITGRPGGERLPCTSRNPSPRTSCRERLMAVEPVQTRAPQPPGTDWLSSAAERERHTLPQPEEFKLPLGPLKVVHAYWLAGMSCDGCS